MAKPNDAENQTLSLTWGTWEELLLACAVHRYGTKSWESVTMEIQKRSSNLNSLTAQSCKQKFHDLKRRFMDQNDDDVVVDGHDDKTIRTIPWLEELRKLRVAELKREVERYDLSIVSLQLKVKRLKEEREQSSRENEEDGEKSDQEKNVEEEKKDADGEPEKSSPDCIAGEPIAGEDSDRDNQSVNESNSTERKGDNLETGPEEAEDKPEPVKSDDGEPCPAGECIKPAGEDSFNGSSDTIAKESPVENSERADPARESGDSPELWESVAESKDGGGGGGGAGAGAEEGLKENSDVQSSVKSQPENEDQSPAIKRTSVKSQPLVDFLDIIRSHRLGSIFERRLEIQETTKYTSLIRQHIDLETVQTRLGEGCYSDCNNRKFFRDLLLLFNNATVFFGQRSSESTAAFELRQLVSKEMAQRAPRKPDPPLQQPVKPDTEQPDSLLVKQKISGPLIACRKRSSIATKPSTTSSGGERKREQTTALAEDKPSMNWKQSDHKSSVVAVEENRITKKRTRERFTPSARKTKSSKSRTSTNTSKNSDPNLNNNSEAKMDKKKNKSTSSITTSTSSKKRGVASFLSRMKRSSSSNNNGSLLETLKSSMANSENGRGGAENRKNGSSSRSDARRDLGSRRGYNGKQAKEQGSPAKRSVGRPPKRSAAVAAPVSLPPPVSGKRSREAGEMEAVASRQAKKRSRK